MKKNLTPILVSLGVLAVIVFVVFAIMNPKNDSASTNTTALTAQQQAQLKQGDSKGDPQSRVVVTEFGDFQCPACGAFEEELQANVLPQYGSKINFVFKNFPLVNIHKNALSAAKAAQAAGAQGKFWEMHDTLYAKQDEWSELDDPQSKYESYAAAIGLDVSKFKSDMKSSAIASKIDKDSKLAEEIKIPGTPSFFVNGVLVTTNTVSDLTNAIDKALAQ